MPIEPRDLAWNASTVEDFRQHAGPAWVRNIQVNPVVSIEVGDARFEARAMVQEGQERRRLLDAHIVAIPIFAKYEEMAGRALPVVTLEPLE